MSEDPFAARSRQLLKAFDFAAESAAKDETHRKELEALLLGLLEVVDSLDRLADAPPPPEDAGGDHAPASRTGSVRLIVRQLERVLSRAGVRPIACLGQRLDPDRHEVVGVNAGADAEEDTVVEVTRRGYDWNGRLLRRPQVVIAVKRGAEEQ